MAVRLTYHGSPNASSILQEGFRPGRMLSVAPGQVFSTPNVNFASGYGNPVKMATSTNAFSLPSVNLSSGQIGREVIQSPQNATRGMQLAQMAERLKNVSPTAARLLEGKTIRGIGGSSMGRSILGRTLGTILGGTVVGTGGMLASPYIAMANHLYGPNVQKAQDFAGMYGEAMPEDMYEEYSSYLGKQGIPQALSDTVLAEPPTGIMNIETPKGFDYNFDENVLKEEEDAQYNLDNKRSFNMDGMLQNLGGYAKDAAGRYIGSQALGGAGAMLLGPVGGVVGGIAGLLGGRDLFNSPYIGAGAYTMDQYGNMYTADQLNKMNARGGYYSEPARDSRRRDQSIRRMEERKAQGLGYGINRLEQLKQQAAQEEAARQSALDAYFGGSDAGADSGRFDGASSRSEYDSNPTGYSGPF
jgi:outer membrane lipoprotein SlyB